LEKFGAKVEASKKQSIRARHDTKRKQKFTDVSKKFFQIDLRAFFAEHATMISKA